MFRTREFTRTSCVLSGIITGLTVFFGKIPVVVVLRVFRLDSRVLVSKKFVNLSVFCFVITFVMFVFV